MFLRYLKSICPYFFAKERKIIIPVNEKMPKNRIFATSKTVLEYEKKHTIYLLYLAGNLYGNDRLQKEKHTSGYRQTKTD
jgi:hypothetical protein